MSLFFLFLDKQMAEFPPQWSTSLQFVRLHALRDATFYSFRSGRCVTNAGYFNISIDDTILNTNNLI